VSRRTGIGKSLQPRQPLADPSDGLKADRHAADSDSATRDSKGIPYALCNLAYLIKAKGSTAIRASAPIPKADDEATIGVWPIELSLKLSGSTPIG